MARHKKLIVSVVVMFLLIAGYFVLDNLLFDGIRPKAINQNGFQGNFYVRESSNNNTAVVLLGGGQWGDYWAQYFAQNDMAGLSLPYIGQEGLPRLPEEIDLEYFERAIKWLGNQPEVNAEKIVVMGASRNAELALILASTFKQSINGVVAYAPSSVSWSNTVLPYNSDELKASWKLNGKDVDYVHMSKLKEDVDGNLKMLDYWKNGLKKSDSIEDAKIKVENINGPILLISGNNDYVWPASQMADSIESRLKKRGFKYKLQNLKYDDAGHSISSNPDHQAASLSQTIEIDGIVYQYQSGGTPEGNYKAKQEARKELMKFLKKL